MSSCQGLSRGHLPLQLLCDKGDGRKRRAELVGGGRGKTVKRGEALLPCQDQLRGSKRLGHLARLLTDAPSVKRDERDA